jgi:hypothetical protein
MNLEYILHRIRVRLYPNYLPKGSSTYVARTVNEKTLSVEDVCTALKTRGGFIGNYEDMLEYVRLYHDEVAYQLCDGYAITNSYYSVYPNIGGTFNSVHEAHDHKKHPINFRFSVRSKLQKLISNIAVDVEGIADSSGYIDEFIDFEKDSVNGIFLSGNQFAIHGNKIKIMGEDPNIGVYFVPVDDPSRAVKVERVAENNPSKITGIIPQINSVNHRIEVRTQYAGSNSKLLKKLRTITSAFILEAA